MTAVRWILAVPAAFVASVVMGFAASFVVSLFGGATWYTLLLSGAGSAWAFFSVSFRVAPRVTPQFKWLVVVLVGSFGAMSAIGSLTSEEPIGFITGGTMLVLAIAYAKTTPAELQLEVGPSPEVYDRSA